MSVLPPAAAEPARALADALADLACPTAGDPGAEDRPPGPRRRLRHPRLHRARRRLRSPPRDLVGEPRSDRPGQPGPGLRPPPHRDPPRHLADHHGRRHPLGPTPQLDGPFPPTAAQRRPPPRQQPKGRHVNVTGGRARYRRAPPQAAGAPHSSRAARIQARRRPWGHEHSTRHRHAVGGDRGRRCRRPCRRHPPTRPRSRPRRGSARRLLAPARQHRLRPLTQAHQATIAYASISTRILGSSSADTATMVAAGRTSSNTSLWARATRSASAISVT